MYHGSVAPLDARPIWKGLAVLVIHQGVVTAAAAAWRSLIADLAVFFHLYLAQIVLVAVLGPAGNAERHAIAEHVLEETVALLAAYVPRHVLCLRCCFMPFSSQWII